MGGISKMCAISQGHYDYNKVHYSPCWLMDFSQKYFEGPMGVFVGGQ